MNTSPESRAVAFLSFVCLAIPVLLPATLAWSIALRRLDRGGHYAFGISMLGLLVWGFVLLIAGYNFLIDAQYHAAGVKPPRW